MDQFKRSIDDRRRALPLPELIVERPIHILNVLAVPHHRKVTIFAFN
jgi:hypothetical protein